MLARGVRTIRWLCALLVVCHFGAVYLGSQHTGLCDLPILNQSSWFKQTACPWYTSHVEPQRKQFVMPLALQWQKYELIARHQVECASQSATQFTQRRVVPCLYKWYHVVRIKAHLYHNVYVVPKVKHILYRGQLWLQSDSDLANAILKALTNLLRGWNAAKSAMQRLEVVAKPLAMNVIQRTKTLEPMFRNAQGMFVDFQTAVKRVFDDKVLGKIQAARGEQETQWFDAADDYEDDETLFITSTIIETVTLSDNDLVAPAAPSDDANMAVEIPLSDLVQEEFQAWSNTIKQKSLNTIQQFDSEIEDLVDEKLGEVQPRITVALQKFTNSSQHYYQTINRAILDVNCTMELDPETGEQLFFNKEGGQLREYVTRPLVREFFAQAHEHVDKSLETTRALLESFVAEINSAVDQIRQEQLEVYEEWGDVMVSEWSKRMAYIDVVAAMDSQDLNQRQHDNWKQFLKLKKQVIATRDLLMEHAANLQPVEKVLTEVQYTLKAIQREAGEYLFILRSKANLAFQAREEQERKEHREQVEREQREREELERVETQAPVESESPDDLRQNTSDYSDDDNEDFEDLSPEAEAVLLRQEQLQREKLDAQELQQRQQFLQEQSRDEENHSSQT
ncbi:LADA_0G15764g1_1 [Lachancea dasiensis]|uniref:LADA_0G15764g1_1 n=1 Tax=Lachancea dasiensis TaxID=1072105 RepID=A0A1G4JWP4_9SACH|nr:LADA_0G15764g1_1 [Lachancea dasiensis]